MRRTLTDQRDLIQRNCALLKGWQAYAYPPVEDPELGTLLRMKVSFRNRTPINEEEVTSFLTELGYGYLPERTVNEFGHTYEVFFKETQVPTTPQFMVARAASRTTRS